MINTNPFSYKYIQNSLRNFRSLKNDDFNWYDEPGTYWFKPVFYFYRSTIESEADDINNEGLLHPSWIKESIGDGVISNNPGGMTSQERKAIIQKKFVSSAYNYLMRNDEEQRAGLLKQFITLLSNIVSRSPWYFQEVAGLDTAVDHTEAFKDGKFVGDTTKQITFTLLPDAVDDRIGTLIDLYRSICYSWREKKEILPANLRKFDMGLYVHGSMIQNNHSNKLFSKAFLRTGNEKSTQLGIGYEPDTEIVDAAGRYRYNSGYTQSTDSSHVYFEFINCEIDLSSSKGGDTISNAEGSERKYTLTISYDDCYVNRYNSFIVGSIGDILRKDIAANAYGKSIDTALGRKPEIKNELTNGITDTINEEATSVLSTLEANTGPIGRLETAANKLVSTLEERTVGRVKKALGSIDQLSKRSISNLQEKVNDGLNNGLNRAMGSLDQAANRLVSKVEEAAVSKAEKALGQLDQAANKLLTTAEEAAVSKAEKALGQLDQAANKLLTTAEEATVVKAKKLLGNINETANKIVSTAEEKTLGTVVGAMNQLEQTINKEFLSDSNSPTPSVPETEAQKTKTKVLGTLYKSAGIVSNL